MRAWFGSLLVLCAVAACDEKPPTSKDDAKADAKADANGPIGAFSKYQAKSMASEAKINLSGISTGARIAFEEERAEPGSLTVVTGQLPPSAPMTPAAGACCKEPDGTCAPDMGDWNQEGWKTVGFAPRDPHRYSYEMITKDQTVTIRAQADLDCDGVLSTYETVGTVVDGSLEFSPKLTETNPLE